MIYNDDCFKILPNIKNDSIDLILTDPPYAISKESNFDKINNDTPIDMAKKYNYSTNFGDWDQTEIDLDKLFSEAYRILKPGGTLIIFYDIWKSNNIKEYALKYKFKQPRICQWVKSNPMPINSKNNYLSNSIEFFFTFVKKGKPVFNSEYDNGIYNFPFSNGNKRKDYYHPTQKPLSLISNILIKHSKKGDLILDPFGGSGTLAEACILNDRDYILIEIEKKYYDIIIERVNSVKKP
jgi:site-specific DNA-methyltransferase (adenine-specific)